MLEIVILIVSIFALILMLILVGFLVLFLSFMVSELFFHIRGPFIPYVQSPYQQVLDILPAIYQEFPVNQKHVTFVELGGGLSRLGRMLEANYEFQKIMSVEINPILVFLARLIAWFKKSEVQIIQQNIFEFVPEKGSVVYCYLSPPIMQKLEATKTLQGCLVISLRFAMPSLSADKEFELAKSGRKIFIYDLR